MTAVHYRRSQLLLEKMTSLLEMKRTTYLWRNQVVTRGVLTLANEASLCMRVFSRKGAHLASFSSRATRACTHLMSGTTDFFASWPTLRDEGTFDGSFNAAVLCEHARSNGKVFFYCTVQQGRDVVDSIVHVI